VWVSSVGDEEYFAPATTPAKKRIEASRDWPLNNPSTRAAWSLGRAVRDDEFHSDSFAAGNKWYAPPTALRFGFPIWT
jgi:hypothetical protein